MLKDRIRVEKYKALPDKMDDFNRLFIDTTKGKFGELKEVNLLKRRILGLTSYFRSAQEAFYHDMRKQLIYILKKFQ